MDSEFNLLSTLFQSLAHDLKASTSAWDVVCHRATKLATQLNATVTSLSGFVGASRDIGASLTRFCLRQRSLENSLRTIALALNDQFVVALEKKSGDCKHRVAEIERKNAKNFKKTRSKKQNLAVDSVSEQREACAELLLEQRRQFLFFINTLLPVMNTEVKLLDEGTHVREVRDSIEGIINDNDSHTIVQTVLEDLGNQGDSSWQRRIVSPSHSTISSATSATIGSQNGTQYQMQVSSHSANGAVWERNKNAGSETDSIASCFSRPHTITAGAADPHFLRRAPISSQTFLPPSDAYTPPMRNSAKPPLPRRQTSANSDGQYGHVGTPMCEPVTQSLSVSTNDLTQPMRRPRPLSFSGCEGTEFSPEDSNLTMSDRTHAVRSSASLIAETLQQIDQLGVELDSYCRTLQPVGSSSGISSSNASYAGAQNGYSSNAGSGSGSTGSGAPTPVAASDPSVGGFQSVRYRPDSIRPPPPPPERRNSTITAATPTAPSVADIRSGYAPGLHSRAPSNQNLAYGYGVPQQSSHYAASSAGSENSYGPPLPPPPASIAYGMRQRTPMSHHYMPNQRP
ncbi:Protein M04F3.5 [Aphelenchoides avenae]|nr:Protein M04F3.5 [Aphelenchus avenae]